MDDNMNPAGTPAQADNGVQNEPQQAPMQSNPSESTDNTVATPSSEPEAK
jgi:hypothetical protein